MVFMVKESMSFIKRRYFMKYFIGLSGIVVFPFVSYSQNVDKTVSLGEVEIKAAKIINKVDGLIVFPTKEQKSSSTSGYDFLQKLFLPGIRVDDVANNVSVIDMRGGIQIRINGVVADKNAMLSLLPEKIVKVDFVDNPGVRYGDGLAYVIDIYTSRDDNGYNIGVDAMQAVTANNGNYNVYGKWNTGKSEISVNYGFGYSDSKGYRMEEKADYHLTDGSVYTIKREDFASRSRSLWHDVKFTYNFADSTNHVFQASLSGNFSKTPDNYNKKNITECNEGYVAVKNYSRNSESPVLDLYYFGKITSKQSFTANVVGTYIKTSGKDKYDERNLYEYGVKGKTGSVLGEAIYENRLKLLTLSAGLNFKYKHTDNKYIGNVSSVNVIDNSRLYGFAEMKGSIRDLRYSVGIGASYIDYKQQKYKYKDCLFCPKLFLAYNFTNEIQLSYNFMSNDRMSQIAMISDAVIRNNSMEWTKGSPDLRSSRDVHNTLKLLYNNSKVQTFIQGYYKVCHHPNMALYERTDDNKFIYTQRNQKEIDVLNVIGYVNWWVIPDKLSASVNGGLFRCFNFGDNYTHCNTSYFVTGAIAAYMGKFSLYAYADNGFRFMEGETKGYSGGDIALKAAYSYKGWQLSATWQKPFIKRYKMFGSELQNENLKKSSALYSSDSANMVTLKVTWKFNAGRKYKSSSKNINLKDVETGILK